MTILQPIFAQQPDAPAVIADGKVVSFGELCSDVLRAAAYLTSLGLDEKSAIGIGIGTYGGDGSDYASWIAHLASIRIGAAHASIPDPASLDALVEGSALDLLLGKLPDERPGDAKLRVLPFELASLPHSSDAPDGEASAARLNLTSGTTGTPKVVRWNSATLAARIEQVAELDLINPDTRLASLLAPRTTGGFRYPIAVWQAGGAVLLDWGRKLGAAAAQSTLYLCSAFQLHWLRTQGARWPNRESRTVVTLGGRVQPKLRDWALANLAGRVLINYGSTETGNIARGEAQAVDRHAGAVGWVRPGVEVEIVAPGGEPVPAGQVGKLRLRVPPELLAEGAEVDEDGFFEPGDQALLFEDGLLAIAGRASEVMNFGGLKISVNEIESKLGTLDDIEDLAAALLRSANGDALGLAVVARAGATAAGLVAQIKPRLPSGLPFQVMVVSSIPRNAMGKVDRATLGRELQVQLQRYAAQQREPAA